MISIERLKELLSYDPETGIWTWLVDRGPGARAGTIAGSKEKHGYIRLRIDGRGYRSGRLAFLYMTGKWPVQQVDHIDRCRANDRWANLREASTSQNQANRGARSDNKLGMKGVTHTGRPLSKPYLAQITINGKPKHLGLFATMEEASAAYADAAKHLFGEFSCAG